MRRLLIILLIFIKLNESTINIENCNLFKCEQKHYVDDDYLNKTYALSCNIVNNIQLNANDIIWQYEFDSKTTRNAIINSKIYGPFEHVFDSDYSQLKVQIVNKSYLTNYRITHGKELSCGTTIQLRSKLCKLDSYRFFIKP